MSSEGNSEVNSEVAVEVVEDSNHRRLMSNQSRLYNMILNRLQMSPFTNRSERKAKSKLISETLRCLYSINNRNPIG